MKIKECLVACLSFVIVVTMFALPGCSGQENNNQEQQQFFDVGENTPNRDYVNIMVNVGDWNVESSNVDDLSIGDVVTFNQDGSVKVNGNDSDKKWSDEGYAEDSSINLTDGEHLYEMIVDNDVIVVGDLDANKVIYILRAS